MATIQLKLSISEELNAKLEAAKERFQKRTTNSIASEIVQDYLSLWEIVEERRRKIVERQTKQELKKPVRKKKPRKRS